MSAGALSVVRAGRSRRSRLRLRRHLEVARAAGDQENCGEAAHAAMLPRRRTTSIDRRVSEARLLAEAQAAEFEAVAGVVAELALVEEDRHRRRRLAEPP